MNCLFMALVFHLFSTILSFRRCGTGNFEKDGLCFECPNGKTTILAESSGIDSCVCNYSSYGTYGSEACTPCGLSENSIQLTRSTITETSTKQDCVCGEEYTTAENGGVITCTLKQEAGKCGSGYYYFSFQDRCEPCAFDHYKVGYNTETSCENCPIRTSGSGNRNTYESCLCDAGNYNWRNNIRTGEPECYSCTGGSYSTQGLDYCILCPKGTYSSSLRAKSIDTCTQCTGAHVTTEFEGSTSQFDCGCDFGYYEDNDVCVKCPDGTTTKSFDSQWASDCIPYSKCDPGKEEKPSGSGTCVDCELGYYRSKETDLDCQQCKQEKTTEFTGSISLDSCVCATGKYYDSASKTCKSCQIGSYKDTFSNDEECILCSNNKTTESIGSKSIQDCICGFGMENINDECKFCQEGYNSYTKKCENCPENSVTDGAGKCLCTLEGKSPIAIPRNINGNNQLICVCEESENGEYFDPLDCSKCAYGFEYDPKTGKNCSVCVNFAEINQFGECECKDKSIDIYQNIKCMKELSFLEKASGTIFTVSLIVGGIIFLCCAICIPIILSIVSTILCYARCVRCCCPCLVNKLKKKKNVQLELEESKI